jgi:hypothetical protein
MNTGCWFGSCQFHDCLAWPGAASLRLQTASSRRPLSRLAAVSGRVTPCPRRASFDGRDAPGAALASAASLFGGPDLHRHHPWIDQRRQGEGKRDRRYQRAEQRQLLIARALGECDAPQPRTGGVSEVEGALVER